MKCTIPEISWHNRDPVLSLDIQQSQADINNYRLASGGTDTHVVVWQLCILDNGAVSVEMLSDLTRHNRPVNAVRFSPNGKILGSSDDEAAIILWKKSEESNEIFMEENEKENKEHWSILKMLRGHIEDVYDLSWSSCSHFLISGSVDNSALMWDVQKGKSIGNLNDHKGFVQGVAWDPKGKYCATLCSDRCLRVYNISTKKSVCKAQKCLLPTLSHKECQKPSHLFYDDTLKSFCRRLSFSPDGNLLIAPSGIIEDEQGKYSNVVHVFSRSMLSRPVMCLPTHDKFTIAVKFCPLLFELKLSKNIIGNKQANEHGYTNLFDLPYRMIFAVATQNAVLIYDTQQPIPFAKISNIHYTRISDLSWSSDGCLLVISSTDGYVSLVSFSKGELGTPYISLDTGSDKSPSQKVESKDCNKLSPKTNTCSKPSPKTVNSNKLSPKIINSNKASPKIIKSNKSSPKTGNMDKTSPKALNIDKPLSKTCILSNSFKVTNSIKVLPCASGNNEEMELLESETISTNLKVDKSAVNIDVSALDLSDEVNKDIKNSEMYQMESKIIEKKSQDPVNRRKDHKPGKRVQLITLSTKVEEKLQSITPIPVDPLESQNGQSPANNESLSKEEPSTSLEKNIKQSNLDEIIASQIPKVSQKVQQDIKTPRRVSLITLSSPKNSKSFKDKPC